MKTGGNEYRFKTFSIKAMERQTNKAIHTSTNSFFCLSKMIAN